MRFAFLPLLFVAACADSNQTTVTGKVLLDGKPVYRAGVQFWPKGDFKRGVFLAITDEDGRFTVKPRLEPYVPPGVYNVLIGRSVKKDGQVPNENDDMGVLNAPGMMKNDLPARYFNRNDPLFTIEIKPGPNELPPFELQREPAS